MTALEWTQALVKQNTISPSGNEEHVLSMIADELQRAGFFVTLHPYDQGMPGRCSLTARLSPNAISPALLFGGHIDTVPLGTAPWSHDPFLACCEGGFIHGRGSVDMKSGIGCMLSACLSMAGRLKGRDLAIHIYGGEETGNLGSSNVARHPELFKGVAAAIVCEPTACAPKLGHRGCLWLKARSAGKTAHASMPEQGDNALCKLIRSLAPLTDFNFPDVHPVLGRSSFVISTMKAGININSVPDFAEATIDIRCLPGQTAEVMIEQVQKAAGPDAAISEIRMIPAVWTDPGNSFVKKVFSLFGGGVKAEPVAFFTDASSLQGILGGAPIIIMGPGMTEMAHQTDEKCALSDIAFMEDMYKKVIASFYGL